MRLYICGLQKSKKELMSFNFFQRYVYQTENYPAILRYLARIYLHLIPIKVRGAWFYINPRDTSVAIQLFSRTYEVYSTYVFSKLLRGGMVVCDIGAHVGLYTIIAAKSVGAGGKVYSFEPEPDNYKFLLKNIKLNQCSNIHPFQLAITEKSGKVKLYLSENSQDHRLIDFKRNRKDFIKVSQDSLDNIISDQRVDLIKIDVQGVEESCIEGMRKIINKNKNLMMIVEFWPEGLMLARTNPLSFLKKLSKEFKIYLLDEIKMKTEIINDFSKLLNHAMKVGYVNLLCKK